MTPNQFFEAFVEENFSDFMADPGSIRRAFNAAVSASHLADHYLEFNRRNHPELVSQFKELGDFVQFICGRTCGAFRDIRSISNAYKHLYTDVNPKKAVHSSVASTGALECIVLDDEDSDLQGMEERSESENATAKILYRRKDGQQLELAPVLAKVVEFWSEFLYAKQSDR